MITKGHFNFLKIVNLKFNIATFTMQTMLFYQHRNDKHQIYFRLKIGDTLCSHKVPKSLIAHSKIDK